MSVIVVEVDGVVVGVVGIRDELRPEASEAIRLLTAQGIDTVMLTGDNTRTARALAAEAGIGAIRAEQMPQDKAEAINRSTATAMIGDIAHAAVPPELDRMDGDDR